MKLDDTKVVAPFISIEGPEAPAPAAKAPKRLTPAESHAEYRARYPKEAVAGDLLKDPEPWRSLSREAALLEVLDWCHGSWTIKNNPDGWKDERSGRFVSIGQVREAVAARMVELGVSKATIEDFIAPRFFTSIEASIHFDALSFDERMNVVRRGSL